MSEILGLYAMWLREIKVFSRETSRIISSIFSPLLWLFIFGGGLGASVRFGEINYQTFIYPGIVCMAVLFSSVFFGVYIIWDRKIDFLKEVMVAPLSRSTIFFGKALGGITDSMIQSSFLLLLAPVLDVPYSLNFLLVLVFIFFLALGMVSLGLILGSLMESPEGFGLVISFVVFPLFFLSGALYPTDNLPPWLGGLVRFDPVTYGVDGIRGLMIGTHVYPIFYDLAVLIVFSMAAVFVGTRTFRRMKIG